MKIINEKKLKILLLQKDIKVEELVKHIKVGGMHIKYFYLKKSGRFDFSLDEIVNMCAYLNCEASDFLCDEYINNLRNKISILNI